MSNEKDDYRGRRDADTLRDAEAIRSDKERMAAASRHLQHAVSAFHQVTGKREKKMRGGRRGATR